MGTSLRRPERTALIGSDVVVTASASIVKSDGACAGGGRIDRALAVPEFAGSGRLS